MLLAASSLRRTLSGLALALIRTSSLTPLRRSHCAHRSSCLSPQRLLRYSALFYLTWPVSFYPRRQSPGGLAASYAYFSPRRACQPHRRLHPFLNFTISRS